MIKHAAIYLGQPHSFVMLGLSALVWTLLASPAWGAAGQGEQGQQQERPRIEVVFALDTTGSMSGLIEGAKRKIWAIVSEIIHGDPTPELQVGLVAYRDRGDEYVIRVNDLSTDIDAVFAKLTGLSAAGGGDTPEDVNQALHAALNRMSWSQGNKVLRIIFLVGDAPPHMDYKLGPKYFKTCKLARKRGIFVNSIRAGGDPKTEQVWKHIADLGDGRYFSIEQSGGMLAMATPYDDKLAELARELDETRWHTAAGPGGLD